MLITNPPLVTSTKRQNSPTCNQPLDITELQFQHLVFLFEWVTVTFFLHIDLLGVAGDSDDHPHPHRQEDGQEKLPRQESGRRGDPR